MKWTNPRDRRAYLCKDVYADHERELGLHTQSERHEKGHRMFVIGNYRDVTYRYHIGIKIGMAAWFIFDLFLYIHEIS